jgi:hypothetical protein
MTFPEEAGLGIVVGWGGGGGSRRVMRTRRGAWSRVFSEGIGESEGDMLES